MTTPETNQIVTDGKLITLNDGQIEAVRRGKEILDDIAPPNGMEYHEDGRRYYNFFTVAGSAGSGKTTIAKAILEGRHGIVVTAPTHKAKKVAARSTGYEAKTIHKIVGLKPNVELAEFNQNNVLFSLLGENLMRNYKIILVDEASMLNKDLVELIKEKSRMSGIKVIFLGDPRQLPPVGEGIGSVFTDEDICQIRLTKVERQAAGNPLMGLYDKILNHIDFIDKCNDEMARLKELKQLTPFKTGQLTAVLNIIPYKFDSCIVDGMGYEFFKEKSEFGEKLVPYFKIGEDLDNKVLCWSNKTATQWNNYIRQQLLGDLRAPLQKGEFIMGYRTVTNPNVFSEVWFENSADYMVMDVQPGFKIAQNYEETKRAEIKGNWVTIKEEEGYPVNLFFVDEASKMDFWSIEKEYADFANTAKNRKWAWKIYYDFRNQYCLLGDIMVGNKKVVEKDFDFAYAITSHKSQGSTYENVFVILGDISSNDKPSERFRLEYVALSRPRHIAHILIN